MRITLAIIVMAMTTSLSAQIGLNVLTPNRDIDAAGSMRIFHKSTSSNSPQLDLQEDGGVNSFNRLKFSNPASSGFWLIATRATDTVSNTEGRFNIFHPTLGNALVIRDNNSMGLGVTPAAFLHLNAPLGQDLFRIQQNGSTKLRIFENGSISIGTNNTGVSPNDVYFHHNVGIGQSVPSERLDVNGNIKTNGFIMPSGANNGYVLTSDANGNASWTMPNSANSINDLQDAKTGGNSLFLGTSAGLNDDGTSNSNIGIGDYALHDNLTGYQNVAIGQSASYNNNGNRNVVVGYQADYYNQSGWNNTILGYNAGGGTANHTKNGNIFIGALAGFYETGNDKLYIHNNNTTVPLIWGDFTSGSEQIKINGDFEVKNTETAKIYNLQLPTNATSGYVLTSDATGNATWQELSIPPDDDWSFDGNGNIYTFDKVGIGATASTSSILNVGGVTSLSTSIYSRNNLTNGYGIVGNTWASGYSVGVLGSTNGAASSSTQAIGVLGQADSGIGVKGEISNTNGIAILGTRSGTIGLAGRFEGPVEVTGKLSVGANPSPMAYNVVVDGSAAKSVGGTTWVNLSDRRLQDVLGDYAKGLDEINKLNTVMFTYKKDNPLNLPHQPIQYGFIAQEVQEIYPEAVDSADGEYLDFNFHPILVSMVNAIQELNAELQAQRLENQALKDQLAQQESRLAALEAILIKGE